MTLDQIATQMGTTRDDLRGISNAYGTNAARNNLGLRDFIRYAFSDGHDLEAIQAYIDRSEIMVIHALRMSCMDRDGCLYGQTLAEISHILRKEAA